MHENETVLKNIDQICQILSDDDHPVTKSIDFKKLLKIDSIVDEGKSPVGSGRKHENIISND